MLLSFDNRHPSIAADVFIAETAVIVGDVKVGSKSSIWYNVVIRGDINCIRIGCQTNIQDLSLLHVAGVKADGSGSPLIIGDNVTVGHHVILHSCTVEDNAFIGMNAVVMDRVVVGKGALVAAGSLVPEGTVITPGTLWMGSPAKFKRFLTDAEKAKFLERAVSYSNLATAYLDERFSPDTENLS